MLPPGSVEPANDFLSLLGLSRRGPRPLWGAIFVAALGLAASAAMLINLTIGGRTSNRALVVAYNLAFVALSSTAMIVTFLLLSAGRRAFRPTLWSLSTAAVTGLVALAYTMARTGHRAPNLPEVLLFVGHAVNVGIFLRLGIALGATRLPAALGLGLASFAGASISGVLNAIDLWLVPGGAPTPPEVGALAWRVLAAAIGGATLALVGWPAIRLVRGLDRAAAARLDRTEVAG